MNLASKRCVPCEGGVPPLEGEELSSYLKQVSSWNLIDGGKKIQKEFRFPDFKQALAFVNKVGKIAEKEDHHPDIELSWGKVVVTLWTHAIGGLSENDFILAAKIDQLTKSA